MKTILLWFFAFFISQVVYSQENKVVHSFKIVGKTKLITNENHTVSVEYQKDNTDHIVITDKSNENTHVIYCEYLYKGKIFDLQEYGDYLKKGLLVKDGTFQQISRTGINQREIKYKDGEIFEKTDYYDDGTKQLWFEGNDKLYNGAFKMWHPNGQISFSGNYQNNQKHGEFNSYNSSGIVQRTGIYENGKLISGIPVVQDILYENPEVNAQQVGSEKAFNEYLERKARSIDLRSVNVYFFYSVVLNLYINKNGTVEKIESKTILSDTERKLVNVSFKDSTLFIPATVEGIPVSSILSRYFFISRRGLTTYNNDSTYLKKNAVLICDQMPEFPGGNKALPNFIAKTMRYPVEAQKRGIKGQIVVGYVVNEQGIVEDPEILKGVDPILNEEAIRVINLLPKMNPGLHNGTPVRVYMTQKLTFRNLGILVKNGW